MGVTSCSWFRLLCIAAMLAIAVATSAGGALSAQRRGDEAGQNPLTGQLIKTGLYMFSGRVNSLLRLTANGLIVVDGQPPENDKALAARIHRISDQPVRLLITTDHHPERIGTNAAFLEGGAQILAQQNVAANLLRANPSGRIPGPTRTYDREQYVTLGGIDVKVMHFGNAHTNGDSIVYFPNLKVVAVGDLFSATGPDPDYSAGGSLVGWGPVLSELLKLDFDLVVPGSGPAASRADLVAFKNRVDTFVTRALKLAQQGVPKDRLIAELQTDDPGWHPLSSAQLNGFYAELSQARQSRSRPRIEPRVR